MLPAEDPVDGEDWCVRELQGYVGELRRAKVEYRNKGGEIRLWKGPEHGRASCIPFGEGVYPLRLYLIACLTRHELDF